MSPAQSYYDPVTSPITSDLQDDTGYLLPDSPTTMDRYIAADADLLLGDPSDLQLLTLPLVPVPVAEGSDPVIVGTHSAGEPDLALWCRRTCLRRALLMWIGLLRGRVTLLGCSENLPGVSTE